MAEGYECDRCGNVYAGSPHTMITVGDGVSRSRMGDENSLTVPSDTVPDETFDVCPTCRAAFEDWWDLEGNDA